MSECKCDELAKKVAKLEHEMGVMKKFKNWATPILEKISKIEEEIKSLVKSIVGIDTSLKYIIRGGLGIAGIISAVYLTQIYPKAQKDQEDRIKFNTQIQQLEIKIIEKLNDVKLGIMETSKKQLSDNNKTIGRSFNKSINKYVENSSKKKD